jgi:hypothetical protein
MAHMRGRPMPSVAVAACGLSCRQERWRHGPQARQAHAVCSGGGMLSFLPNISTSSDHSPSRAQPPLLALSPKSSLHGEMVGGVVRKRDAGGARTLDSPILFAPRAPAARLGEGWQQRGG